mmetsp:Transcript_7197/g.21211  ORF Transcript_7197/g.21211 Transcript_7197/m.21211 type:complete len:391 (-) Transcript_7197:880-2052(-)
MHRPSLRRHSRSAGGSAGHTTEAHVSIPRQVPSMHKSSTVLASLSLHGTKLSSCLPREQPPRKHVGGAWHSSTGHVTLSHGSWPAHSPPVLHTSSIVRMSPSSHGVPTGSSGPSAQTPAVQLPLPWQLSIGGHVTSSHRSIPTQLPSAVHVSLTVSTFPSKQPVPTGASGSVQTPRHAPRSRAAMHVPATVQVSPQGGHTTGRPNESRHGLIPTHSPAKQASPTVSPSPSLHGWPSGTVVYPHCPPEHEPLTRHCPWVSGHATPAHGSTPPHTPAAHVSLTVTPLPSSHGVPLATASPRKHTPREHDHGWWHESATGHPPGPRPCPHTAGSGVPPSVGGAAVVLAAGATPRQTPPTHASPTVAALPSSHCVPSGRALPPKHAPWLHTPGR